MFFESYREIGARFYPAVIGDNHRPVAVDSPKPGDKAAAGYVLHVRVIHTETRYSIQLKELCFRVDQLAYEVAYELLALLCQPIYGFLPSGPRRFIDKTIEKIFLFFPKGPVLGFFVRHFACLLERE